MDTDNIKIGSATPFSLKHSELKNGKGGNKKFNFGPRAPPKQIDVFVNGELVKTEDLPTLVRFSGRAAEAFPKPKEEKDGGKGGEGKGGEGKGGEGKGGEGKGGEVKGGEGKGGEGKGATSKAAGSKAAGADDKVLSEQTGELSVKDADAEPSEPSPEATGKALSSSGNLRLNLFIEGAWEALNPNAVRFCMNWMAKNKHMRHSQMLIGFTIPPPDANQPLETYINVYAAAVAFGLRPFPHNLRQTVLDKVTMTRLSLQDLQDIIYRLPWGDRVVTRAITSFYETSEFHESEGGYTDDEFNAVQHWAQTVDELVKDRFNEIAAAIYRKKKRQEREKKGKQASKEMHELWESMSGVPTTGGAASTAGSASGGDGQKQGGKKSKGSNNTHAPSASTSTQATAASGSTAATSNSGAQAAVPVKEGNKKGVKGKHVPGA